MDLVQAPAQEPQVSEHAAFFWYHLLLLLPNCCAALQRSSTLSSLRSACCCQVCLPSAVLHMLVPGVVLLLYCSLNVHLPGSA